MEFLERLFSTIFERKAQTLHEEELNMSMKIEAVCCQCSKVEVLEVKRTQYEAWKKGAFIQDAFPHLNADERELLISGICGECFDKMFSEEDSDVCPDCLPFDDCPTCGRKHNE